VQPRLDDEVTTAIRTLDTLIAELEALQHNRSRSHQLVPDPPDDRSPAEAAASRVRSTRAALALAQLRRSGRNDDSDGQQVSRRVLVRLDSHPSHQGIGFSVTLTNYTLIRRPVLVSTVGRIRHRAAFFSPSACLLQLDPKCRRA
jgi:hypothetical protein